MKNLFSFSPIFSLTFILILFFGFTSCKKKCVVERQTVNSGSIIQDVVIYPTSGSQTGNMGGDYVIDATHQHALNFEISIDGGARTAVNYSNYTILCHPISANCNASYDRTATINHVNQTVVYKIVVTQCANCTEVYPTENYVLVPSFPSSYLVSYDISYIDK